MYRSLVSIAMTAALAAACSTTKTDEAAPTSTTPSAKPAAAAPATPAPAPAATAPAAANALPDIGLPLAREVEGVLVGGQPSNAVLEAAANAGFKTVINMRSEGEHDSAGERAQVEGLGMTYVALPIGSAADLSEQKAREFDEVLGKATGPVLVHCGSGNRVGAIYALREHFVRGASAADALAFGRRAGLTALAGKVAALLGV